MISTSRLKISVVIPLFNKEKAISETIASVLAQSYSDFDIVVVDDGSTDKSVEIVENISDTRLTLIKKENGGPSSARNMGVACATGEWIYFLDGDDIMEPDCLKKFGLMVKKYPKNRVFVSNFYQRKGKKKKLQSIFVKNGIVRNNFRSWFFDTIRPCQGAVLYKKEILVQFPFPENLRRWEDAAMFFEIMKKEKICSCRFPSFTYELDNSSASKGTKNIEADFLGHLPKSCQFWERMCVCVLYQQARSFYPEESKHLYGNDFFGCFDKVSFFFLRKLYLFMRICGELIYRAKRII